MNGNSATTTMSKYDLHLNGKLKQRYIASSHVGVQDPSNLPTSLFSPIQVCQ